MAGYIPWYGKKRDRLRQVEHDFVDLLRATSKPTALAAGAEALRSAHIRALKARRDYLAPCGKNAVAFENRAREIQLWTNLPVEEIIQWYRDRLHF